MRVAFVADVHVGNPQRFGGDIKAGINKRCQMVLDSLAKAVVIAAANKSEYFVICGDLIDYVKIEPQIIAAIQLILRDAKRLGMQAVLLKGNHENVSQALGDHALGPLKPLARIVEVPTTITHQDGSE